MEEKRTINSVEDCDARESLRGVEKSLKGLRGRKRGSDKVHAGLGGWTES